MKEAFQQGSGALSETGLGVVQVAFTNYNLQGDSMKLVFNRSHEKHCKRQRLVLSE